MTTDQTPDLVTRLRALHRPRTERAHSCCVQCGIVWPCPTSRVLDEAVPSAAAPPTRVDEQRAWLSATLWEIAEQHIIAEWICCEPLEQRHDLCAKGHAALGMARTLLVDSPEAWNPAAPLLDAVLALLRRLAEAPQPETQARPPLHEWFVETRMLDGRWSKYGASRDTAEDGRELFERDTTSSGKAHAFRLVHATTTYAVEAEHAPAVVAQPGEEG